VANEVWSPVEEGSTAELSAGAVYARPELYHLFRSKEELALAVVQWFEETWYEEVGYLSADESDPVGALLAVARGHAVFCRNDVPPVLTTFRAEFEGRDHPVGRAVKETIERIVDDTVRLMTAARRSGAIPPGPPPRELALAYLGALDGVAKSLRGQAPYDAVLAEKAALGLLGLAPAAS
jgi:AcrR family transcriptional regulator